MSKEAKVIRGQVRQVIRECLTEELVAAAMERLKRHIDERLNAIDDKQKDLLSLMVRTAAAQKQD